MKFFNPPFARRSLAVLLVAVFAGVGVTHAQYTGIGTTVPQATLHVVPVSVGQEVLQVESVIDLGAETTYIDVLLYDPSTGLFRRESIEDLLNDNGEFYFDGTRTTARRFADVINFDADDIVLTQATSIGSTLNVTGATTVGGAFTVSGTNTSSLGGVVTLGTVNNHTTPIAGTHEILFHSATGTIEKATVADVFAGVSYWDEAADVLTPSNALLAQEIRIADEDVDITASAIGLTGTVTVTGAATVSSTLGVTGATTLSSTLQIGDVQQVALDTIIGTDEILLQQAGTDLVEYVTVEDLLQSSGEWRYNSSGDHTYASRAQVGGFDVVVDNSNGFFGIGTTSPTDGIQVVGANIAVDGTAAYEIGANSLAGGALNALTLTGTGDYTETITGAYVHTSASAASTTSGNTSITSTSGTISLTANGGPIATMNEFGLGIGTPAITGRLLYTNTADGVAFGSLTQVTDVTLDAVGGVASPVTEAMDNILVTDHTGLIRYIDAADLISTAGEWVYEDAGTLGAYDAGDVVYLRRNGLDGSNDIYASFEGNMVVDVARAYQFGDAANQIGATGITANAAYTMALSNSLTVNTAVDSDVAFNEGAEPWLYYDADAAGNTATERGRVGINTSTPLATLHVAGNIVASNTTVTSDRRFKSNITDLSGALDAITAIRGVSYGFRKDEFPKENFDDREHIGFIAQEIREVLPQTVFERGDGYLTVDYAAVTPVLVEAVKELNAKVEALQAENAALRGTTKESVGAVSTKQLQDLEARLADMDARLREVSGRK